MRRLFTLACATAVVTAGLVSLSQAPAQANTAPWACAVGYADAILVGPQSTHEWCFYGNPWSNYCEYDSFTAAPIVSAAIQFCVVRP